MQHIKVLWNLALIYRGNPRGVVRAYRGWLAGRVQVWALDGEIRYTPWPYTAVAIDAVVCIVALIAVPLACALVTP